MLRYTYQDWDLHDIYGGTCNHKMVNEPTHDVIKEPLRVRELIGVVSESDETLQPGWTPSEYLEFFGMMHGLEKKEIKNREEGLLKDMDLWDVRNRPIKTFSLIFQRSCKLKSYS